MRKIKEGKTKILQSFYLVNGRAISKMFQTLYSKDRKMDKIVQPRLLILAWKCQIEARARMAFWGR